MPIKASELKRRFIVVDEHATVQQVHELVAATGSKWTYIIVCPPNARYAVLRLMDLINELQEHSQVLLPEMLDWALANVPNLLAPRTVQAIDQASMKHVGCARPSNIEVSDCYWGL